MRGAPGNGCPYRDPSHFLAITFPLRGGDESGRLCVWRGGKETKTPAAYFLAPAVAGAVAVSAVWNLPHLTVVLVLSHSSVRGAW